MRLILFSGKGGSGASTLAAATAAAAAAGGRRTLAFGLAPGLGAAFGVPLATDPTEIAPQLFGSEGYISHGAPDEFRDWVEDLLNWRGMDPALAEDLGALPGLNHIAGLLRLADYATSGAYEVIVADAAPLGQFLDLPGALDAAARWLRRLFAPRQQTVFEPLIRAFAGDYASTGEDVFERGKSLLTRLAELRDTLTDPQDSSVRLVLTADAAATQETLQAIGALTLFSYTVDAIVANQLLPDTLDEEFFATRRAEQASAIAHLGETAADIPLFRLPLQQVSPRGLEPVLALARDVYGETDAVAVLHQGIEHTFDRRDGAYVLRVGVPFARREDLRLEQLDDGIAVHLGGRRCVVELPEELQNREAASWTLEGPYLTVVLA